MINKIAILNAEKTLFNSILSRNSSQQYDTEIKKIINTYTKDDEIRNIMDVFKITEEDFNVIYTYILNSFEFSDLIYTDETPCLFATAVLLDMQSVIAIANRIRYCTKTDKNRHDILIENADLTANLFFKEQAVRQNIVSVQYFCRNGIFCSLRK